jgi:hypothetical protein
MASIIRHRRVNIVILAADEAIETNCGPGDIAIRTAPDGWWNSFVAIDGSIDSYDQPYRTYNEALWAAKAAAEFGTL